MLHEQIVDRKLNRDAFVIRYIILRSLDKFPHTVSKLSYTVQTSPKEIKRYIPYLLEHKLITPENKGKFIYYHITPKGKMLLEMCNNMIELLPHQFMKDFQ